MNLTSLLLRPGIYSVAICDYSIVLPFSSLYFMSFDIMTGAIVAVARLDIYIYLPQSDIARVCLI